MEQSVHGKGEQRARNTEHSSRHLYDYSIYPWVGGPTYPSVDTPRSQLLVDVDHVIADADSEQLSCSRLATAT